jgi:hypothetical protein
VPPSSAPPPAPPEADEEDEPYEPDEADEEEFFAEGERLTPAMRALLQIVACFVSPEPIPHALLLAPLLPHAAPEGPAALAALFQSGWLSAPTLITVQLTPKSRAFLATRPSDEPVQLAVVESLCTLVGNLMRARDEATLRLVEPHLLALTDAWQPRADHHALILSLTAGTYHALYGDSGAANVYMDRAIALEEALGERPAKPPKPPRTLRGRR